MPSTDPGFLVDDHERLGVAGAERDASRGRVTPPPDVPGRRALELGEERGTQERLRPENPAVLLGERPLVGSGEHVPVEHPGRGVVDQRSLRRSSEQRLGLRDEELIERVLTRDEDRQPTRPPSGATPLLPQRGDGAGKADGDRAVERADVDPELERLRRGDPEQLALDEAALDLASLLRRVPGPVGSEPRRGRRVQPVAGEAVDELGCLAALREADRAQAPPDQTRQQPGGVPERARAGAELLVEELGVPEHDLALGLRGGVVGHDADVEAREARRELARVGDRRGRENEHGIGVVREREPAQPAQDVADVRAEDAAVDVRLVDDDEPEVVQRVPPTIVMGQHADVEHVGIGEDHVRRAPDVRATLDGRVAVVDRRPQTADPETREPARLILRERLRRIEEDRPRRWIPRDRVQDGEREGERLARRGSRRDDDALPPGDGLPGLGLMCVEPRHAARAEPLGDGGVQFPRERLAPAGARRLGAAVGDLRSFQDGIPGRRLAGEPRLAQEPSTFATASA